MVCSVGASRSATSRGRAGRLVAWAIASMALSASTSLAQLPATRLQALFPPGAKQGSQTTVTITQGVDLEGINRLVFSHPGITAVQATAPVEGKPEPQPVANQFVVNVAPDVPVGLYEARAIGVYGISNPRAFSVGDRAEVAEIEPNNAAGQATEVATGSWINGKVDAAKDIDYFRFAAKAGERLIIDAWAERIDSRLDATLELFDPAGRLVAKSRDVNRRDALIDYAVPADGQYTLKVYDFLYAGSPEHFYRISLGPTAYVDFVFPPAGLPGTKTPFTLYGRNLPGGVPADGLAVDGRPLEKLTVEIELPADPVARQRVNFDAPLDASAAGLDGLNYRIGGPAGMSNPVLIAYATAPPALEQEPNDDKPQPVTAPCEVMGQFVQLGDNDVFSFAGKKDQVFWIEVYSQRLGAGSDPLLIVQEVTKNDKGEEQIKELKAEDDSGANVGGQSFNTATGDPVFRLVCGADAEYRVAVRDLYSELRANPKLVYRLAIRPEQPDFRLVALADFPLNGQAAPQVWTNLLRKGGTDMLRVLALRQDGFAGEIVVNVEGLPEGVTCPATTIGPGQPGAMLVFTAAENAADWTGTITVNGRAKIGEADVVREARPAAVIAAGANRPGISRLTRDLALGVGQLAPYLLKADVPQITVPQSSWIALPLIATRRGDFAGALNITAAGIPANVQNEAITLVPDQTQTTLYLFAQPDAPPGNYSIYAQSATQVPFTKNADGKDKKPLDVVDASTPVTIAVTPGPLVVAPKVPNSGNLKRGATLETPITVTRRNGFAGPVTLDLFLPPGVVGVKAAPVALAADQSEAKLIIEADAEAAEGPRPHVAVRAAIDHAGQKLELHQPIAVNVQK